MARDRAVRSFGFNRAAIGRQKNGGHQAERTEALSHGVGLNVTVVVLACPHVAALPLHGGSDHVVDQAVLVGETGCLELLLVFGVEYFLEQVLELAIVGLEDRVLGGEVDRVVALQAVGERCACEVLDGLVEVVHTHGHAALFRHGDDLKLLWLAAVSWLKGHGDLAWTWHLEVGGLVLVTVRVTADDDRLVPAWNEAWDVRDNDWLAEDNAAEDVADGAVRRNPHLLEAELLNACLIRGDGRALHTDVVLLDGVCSVNGDLVVGRVAVLDRQIVVLQVDVQVRVDEAVLDELPDDTSHLIAVELDDGVNNLDLAHVRSTPRLSIGVVLVATNLNLFLDVKIYWRSAWSVTLSGVGHSECASQWPPRLSRTRVFLSPLSTSRVGSGILSMK